MLDAERGIDNSDEMSKLFEKMDALQAWDFEYQVKEVLGKLGLHDTELPVGNLSGGQRVNSVETISPSLFGLFPPYFFKLFNSNVSFHPVS
jgi:hypothetical protein